MLRFFISFSFVFLIIAYSAQAQADSELLDSNYDSHSDTILENRLSGRLWVNTNRLGQISHALYFTHDRKILYLAANPYDGGFTYISRRTFFPDLNLSRRDDYSIEAWWINDGVLNIEHGTRRTYTNRMDVTYASINVHHRLFIDFPDENTLLLDIRNYGEKTYQSIDSANIPNQPLMQDIEALFRIFDSSRHGNENPGMIYRLDVDDTSGEIELRSCNSEKIGWSFYCAGNEATIMRDWGETLTASDLAEMVNQNGDFDDIPPMASEHVCYRTNPELAIEIPEGALFYYNNHLFENKSLDRDLSIIPCETDIGVTNPCDTDIVSYDISSVETGYFRAGKLEFDFATLSELGLPAPIIPDLIPLVSRKLCEEYPNFSTMDGHRQTQAIAEVIASVFPWQPTYREVDVETYHLSEAAAAAGYTAGNTGAEAIDAILSNSTEAGNNFDETQKIAIGGYEFEVPKGFDNFQIAEYIYHNYNWHGISDTVRAWVTIEVNRRIIANGGERIVLSSDPAENRRLWDNVYWSHPTTDTTEEYLAIYANRYSDYVDNSRIGKVIIALEYANLANFARHAGRAIRDFDFRRVGNALNIFNPLRMRLGGRETTGIIRVYDRATRRTVFNQLDIEDMGPVACGPTSCAMVLSDRGINIDLRLFSSRFVLTRDGTNIRKMRNDLIDNGIENVRIKVDANLIDITNSTGVGNSVVVHVANPSAVGRTGHFVVVDGITRRHGLDVVAIRDPYGGRAFFIDKEEFMDRFTGNALFID